MSEPNNKPTELDKVYSPGQVETKWRDAWRKSKVFHCEAGGTGRPYVIVIPPPNVTGVLHVGHALDNTLQDILIRYHRLLGRPTCWVPGTDHGGIATNSVMERQLKAEGLTRHRLGREKFLERMKAWALDCKSTILGQLARLGCALDWDREAYTMDAARTKAVYHAFEALWNDHLIERRERMVNWCVHCGTALSDIEVEYEDRKGHLWHMRYPGMDGGPGIVVATTRPETMLGDTAVAVNPRDTRYTKLIGQMLRLPLMDRPIPIVADDSVDFAFGTGAVKVTPAHDPNDFEIAERHKLKAIKVIGPDGKLSSAAGRYAGLSREAARENVLKDLGELLVKVEDHPHAVGVCYRCGNIIEPLLSWQWFVGMKRLAEPAIQELDSGAFRLYPDSWTKPYREWLTHIRDWGISRQIWWGHRIPVWYCLNCNRDLVAAAPKPQQDGVEGEWSVHQIPSVVGVVSVEKPARCAKCGSSEFIQDPDVLDTWFSSALWPMSVFGWPEKTKDFEAFYPTEVIAPAYEILYLWVARMQMMGLYFAGKPPFRHALIHGLVRDKQGKKMSKSLGNVIDPLVMMDKYGTDALRFSLAGQAHPGKDIPFAEEAIVGSRNFSNKIWNSTRFVLMNLPKGSRTYGANPATLVPGQEFEIADDWILEEYRKMQDEVQKKLAEYEIAAAADAIYEFLWDKFCDWYVELAKIRLSGPDGGSKERVREVLVRVLNATLKLLHPFMPFVTEELFEVLKPYTGETAKSILFSNLPSLDANDWPPRMPRRDGMGTPQVMPALMEMITSIRTSRSELNVPPGLKIKALFEAKDERLKKLIESRSDYILYLARLEQLEPLNGHKRPAGCVTAVSAGCTFYLPLQGLIDFDKEKARLKKELTDLAKQLTGLEARLSNPSFMERAPREEATRVQKLREELLAKIARIKETLDSLG